MLKTFLYVPGFVVLALLLSSCGSSSEPQANNATIKIAGPTTTTLLASPTPQPTLLSGCSADKIAADVARSPAGGVRCQGDWAYVGWGELGDSQALLRSVGGVWQSFTGFPSALCVDEARSQGVPDAELSNFAPCGRTAPPAPTGDLGLSTPITVPTCDGQAIVVLHSATAPGQYESEVSAALSNNPGALYLRTDQSCPSLRQQSNEGHPIYAVYRPAGRTVTDLCAAVRGEGGGAYGKWLDTTSDPTAIVPC